MAIQHRRGAYANLDPTKAVPGEFLVVLEDDPTSDDGKAAYMTFATGNIKRIATYDEVEHFNEESKEYRDDAKDYRDEVISAASTVQTLASEVAMGAGVATDMVDAVTQEGQNALTSIATFKDQCVASMGEDYMYWQEAISWHVINAENTIEARIDELAEPFIKVQDIKPTDEDNKIWIKETTQAEIEVPTYAEYEGIKNVIDSIGLGLSASAITALLNCFQHVTWSDASGQDCYDALEDALSEIQAVILNAYYITLPNPGDTSQLTATTIPNGGEVTWASSDTSVATVSSSGLVTAVGSGSATITATTSNNKSASCSVLMTQPTVISISVFRTTTGGVYSNTNLDDLKADLVVTANWSNSTQSNVASNDYTLSGTLTVGICTLTVSYGGKSDTFDVVVSES